MTTIAAVVIFGIFTLLVLICGVVIGVAISTKDSTPDPMRTWTPPASVIDWGAFVAECEAEDLFEERRNRIRSRH